MELVSPELRTENSHLESVLQEESFSADRITKAEMVWIDEIKVGERFRQEYKNIEALAASIKQYGLMQFIVIDQENNLVAGGRRFQAVQLLNWKKVQVVRKQNVDPLKLREMELEENLQRESLTWQEEVNLKKEILRIKQELYGVKSSGRSTTGVSQNDVAKSMGDSPANFSMDTTLADAMQVMPELANCKTKDEARKTLKRLQEKLIVNELERRQKLASHTVDSHVTIADRCFMIGDAFEGLKSLNEEFDFIHIDTPYGIDLNNVKKNISETQVIDHDYKEWTSDTFIDKCRVFAEEAYRLGKPDCFMAWWFGIQWYQPLKDMLEEVGWKVDPMPAIWYGGDSMAQTNQPELYLGRSYEAFFSCRKGKPVIYKRGRNNVFEFKKISPDKKIHQTEKPLELIKEIYETFSPIGASILSPVLGSGVDILAAILTNRNCKGFDLNSEVKKRFLIKVDERFKKNAIAKE